MKKAILLAMLIIGTGLTVYPQMPQWCIPPYLVDFSGSSPSIVSSTLTTSPYQRSSNAAFDKNGTMLFYVVNGEIYLPGGTSTGTSVTVTTETGVIPVPGFCNRFYIIGISTAPMATVYLNYSMVEVSGGSVSVVPGFSGINLGAVGGEFAGFAVSKLRTDKTRFLFTIGRTSPNSTNDGANKFLITDAGINFVSTLVNIGFSWENKPWELELYEDPSTGNMKLAWGGSSYSFDQMLHILNLNSSGNYVSAQNIPISGLNRVYGVEFFANGTKAFVSQSNSTSTNSGIAVVDIAGNSTSFISGTQNYSGSQIEKGPDGKYYVINTAKQLSSIDPVTFAITNGPTLTSYTGYFEKTLPDQVDDEPYTTTNFRAELMARDGMADIGLEPNAAGNTSNDLWASPDIWNRRTSLGTAHENPGYGSSSGFGNLIHLRVKNIGCTTSNPSFVRFYWALGSTGEHWPNSWNGTDKINGVDAGGEIKITSTYSTYTINGYSVPSLAPGAEAIVQAKWFPPDPASYNSTSVPADAELCLLGRIDDPWQDPMHDEVNSTTASIRHNVVYNNNIVTRNTRLVNLPGVFLRTVRGGSVLVNNYLEGSALFNVSIRGASENAGSFLDIGNVIVTLSDELWAAWAQGGRAVEGLEVSNWENHEFVVTDIKTATLQNIRLDPGKPAGISISFQLAKTTDLKETFAFGFAQERTDYKEGEERYGSECNFILTVNGEQEEDATTGTGTVGGTTGTTGTATGTATGTETGTTAGQGGRLQTMSANTPLQSITNLVLYPNPSDDKATIRFTLRDKGPVSIKVNDLSGKPVQQLADNRQYPAGQNTVQLNTRDIKAGIYVVSVQSGKTVETVKIKIVH